MVNVKLTSNIQRGEERLEKDSKGNWLRQPQPTIIIDVPIEVEGDAIDIAFQVRGRVSTVEPNKLTNSLSRDFSTTAMVSRSAFENLPKYRAWSIYEVREVPITENFEEFSDRAKPISCEANIFPEVASNLIQETKAWKLSEATFDKAKDFLYDSMGGHLHHMSGNILTAARFIVACREREASSSWHAYDDSRYKELLPEINHLLSLKDPTRSNVRAVEKVKDYLFLAHCPTFWRARPPQPKEFGLEWLINETT